MPEHVLSRCRHGSLPWDCSRCGEIDRAYTCGRISELRHVAERLKLEHLFGLVGTATAKYMEERAEKIERGEEP